MEGLCFGNIEARACEIVAPEAAVIERTGGFLRIFGNTTVRTASLPPQKTRLSLGLGPRGGK
jgi:hypothetical protein